MTKHIPLPHGKFALVDDADFDWLNQWKWHVTAAGYAQRNVPKKEGQRRHIYMHRLIMSAGNAILVDHVNHDTLDNQRTNLRVATHSQSLRNRRANVGGSSVFKGVRVCRNRWGALIHDGKKNIHLGQFLTQREAAQAYNEAAIKYHGEFACLNDLSILPAEQDPPIQPKRGTASPYFGIYKDKRRNHWIASTQINYRYIHIGSFATDLEAAQAYDAYVKEYGLKRKLNFP